MLKYRETKQSYLFDYGSEERSIRMFVRHDELLWS